MSVSIPVDVIFSLASQFGIRLTIQIRNAHTKKHEFQPTSFGITVYHMLFLRIYFAFCFDSNAH